MLFLSILSFIVGVAGLLIRPMDIISPNANTIFSLIAIFGSPLFLIKWLIDKKKDEEYYQSEEYREWTRNRPKSNDNEPTWEEVNAWRDYYKLKNPPDDDDD